VIVIVIVIMIVMKYARGARCRPVFKYWWVEAKVFSEAADYWPVWNVERGIVTRKGRVTCTSTTTH